MKAGSAYNTLGDSYRAGKKASEEAVSSSRPLLWHFCLPWTS